MTRVVKMAIYIGGCRCKSPLEFLRPIVYNIFMKMQILYVGQAKVHREAIGALILEQGLELMSNAVGENWSVVIEALSNHVDVLVVMGSMEDNFWRWIRKIKAHYKHVEILILSDRQDFQLAYAALTNRINNFWLLPVQKEQVLYLIDEILEKHRLEKEAKVQEEKLKGFELAQHQQMMEKIMKQVMNRPEELSMMLTEINHRYDITLENTSFFAMHIIVLDLLNMANPSLILNQIQSLIEKCLSGVREVLISNQNNVGLTAVVNMDEATLSLKTKDQLGILSWEISKLMSREHMQQWVVSIGSVVSDMRHIETSVQSAICGMYRKNITPTIHYYECEKLLLEQDFEALLTATQKQQWVTLLRKDDLDEIPLFLRSLVIDHKRVIQNNPYNLHGLRLELMELIHLTFKDYLDEDILGESLGKALSVWIYEEQVMMDQLTMSIALLKERLDPSIKLGMSDQVQKALDYINLHYNEGITLEEVALAVDLSPNYFSHIFKEEVGLNYLAYLTDYRLTVSAERLRESEEAVLMIAQQVGYMDVKYFRQLFKKKFGVTPAEYRKKL